MILVDLETAKEHLRVTDTESDIQIMRKIQQASAIMVDYLKIDGEIWDQTNSEAEPIPPVVEAAVLLIAEALYNGSEPLSQTVRDLVHRYRDPAFA